MTSVLMPSSQGIMGPLPMGLAGWSWTTGLEREWTEGQNISDRIPVQCLGEERD